MSESNVAQDQIKALVDRILRMKEEAKAINSDIREIYAEAKSNGFDKTVLGKLVTYVEKRQTDASAVLESESLFDLYLTAYDSAVGTKNANAHTHEKNWQAPRKASLGDQKDAYRAGQPISQDFQYENASVYFFAFYEIGRVKIGVSNDVDARLRDLALEQGCEGEILHVMPGNRQAEMAAHTRFDAYRVEGEWFRDCAEVRAMIGEYKVAALRADPAMAIVEAANITPKTQPSQPAGSDLTSLAPHEGQVAPIQPETANEAGDEVGHVALDAADHSLDGTGNAATQHNPGGENVDVPDVPATPEHDRAAEADAAGKPAEASASVAPASKYAAAGVVVWEHTPPEPVRRHPYSAAFGDLGQDLVVIDDDIAGAKSDPIVRIGNEILDGWARYNVARGMIGGSGMSTEYPVMQYAGTDPLLDCIRLNVAGRVLSPKDKQTVAQRLISVEPKRKADILKALAEMAA